MLFKAKCVRLGLRNLISVEEREVGGRLTDIPQQLVAATEPSGIYNLPHRGDLLGPSWRA
jgi:hypothetical protein